MLNPRLADLPDYPFDRLRALLDPLTPPAGMEPLLLSVGEPRHPPPGFVIETMAASERADWGRYPPIDGTPAFRRAVADWLTRRYALPEGAVEPESMVLPVVGTREALFLVSTLVVPEEKGGGRAIVAMPNPFYHVYGGAAAVVGAEPRYLPATAETGFLPDIGRLSRAELDRVALYYLCTPANPQGAAASLDQLAEAITLARRHDFTLVVDECYAEIYTDTPPSGALEACHGLGGGFANVLVFHSLSKRSSAAGLRSGFIAGDPDLVRRFRRLRNYIGPQTPLPTLHAATRLWQEESHVEEVRAVYRANFDVAAEVLQGRYGAFRPDGGFFLWLDVGDGEAAAARLWQEAAVRVLPGAYISHEVDGINPGAPFIRCALVNPPDVTREALERMVRVLG